MPGDGERREGERVQRTDTRLASIENMVKEIKEQMGNVMKKITKIENKITEQSKKIEGLEDLCQASIEMKNEINAIKAEGIYMRKKINELELQGDRRLIKEKRRDIEIYGIPRAQNENCKSLIIKISEAAKVKLEDGDIESCFRPNDYENRQKPIAVRFKTEKIRDTILKEAKRAKLRLGSIGLEPENRKLYVNEALISKRKKLLYLVKEEARKEKWVAVWTFKGAIFIKRTENDPQIKIETEEELMTISN